MKGSKGKAPALRVVIVGSGGRLGGAMRNTWKNRYNLTNLTRADLDLSSAESIRRALEPIEYDRLFIAGALTAVDYCEDHEVEAFAVNASGPRLISEISLAKKAHVTYISTDFVFDGTSVGSYTEEDAARPISVYGASKKKGEEEVLFASDENLVVRVSWLYGAGKPAFPEWIINQARQLDQVALPREKVGTPTCVSDAVKYLEVLVDPKGARPANGIFHVSNSGHCTWQSWGQFCIDEAFCNGVQLRARTVDGNSLGDISAFKAKRPVNSALNLSKLTKHTGISPRPWKDALKEHLATG